MNQKNKIVIFDFDGTLTLTDSTKFLLLSLIIYRPLLIKKLFYLLRIKNKQNLQFQMEKTEIIGNLIKNYSPQILQKRLWLFKLLVKLSYRKEILSKLYSYKKNGYSIVIATASPAFAMSDLFPIDIVIIGTEFKLEHNHYSGQISEIPCFGKNKADAVSLYLKKRGVTQADIAFSDHQSDMPLLMCAKEAYLIKKNRLITLDKSYMNLQ